MALSNQATITLQVNVQNMAGLRNLTNGLMSLRSQIMAIQRNPAMRSGTGAFQTPAQQIRSNAAVQAATIRAAQQVASATQNAAAAQIRAHANVTAAAARSTAAQVRGATMVARAQGALAAVLARLSRGHGAAGRAARDQTRDLRSLSERIKDAEENVDALWRAAFRLQMLGADFSRMGRGILDAVTGVTDTFGAFEFMANRAAGALGGFEAMNADAAVTTTDLQNAIMDTSQELRLFPAEEVAKAVYFWGSTTGQVVETQEDLYNVMDSLVPVMQAAALTETSYEMAIKGTYSILTQYYGAVVETANATGDYNEMTRLAEEVTVRMFYATQKTALEFDDLVQSFKMVGPVAAGVGASFEDMINLLGRLGDLGVRGSMAGRSFRQMFMRMVSPPGPARDAIATLWESLGDPLSDLFNKEFQGKSYMEMMFPQGEFVGTEKFLRNMTLAVKDLTTAERISFLTKFSTANLLPTMIALIGQETRAIEGNAEGYDKLGATIEQQRALFQASWGLLANSWQGITGEMQRAVENLQITIGRGFANAFRPFVESATVAIQKVREWVLANPELVEQLGKLAGIAGTALLALGALFTTVGTAIGVLAGLKLAFDAFGGVFLRWTGIGIFIGAIVDSIIRNFEEVRSRVQVIMDAIGEAFTRIASYFGDGTESSEDLAQAFRPMADTVVDVLLKVIETIVYFVNEVSKFKPLFDLIKNFVIPVAGQFLAVWAAAKFVRAAAGILGITKAIGVLATVTARLAIPTRLVTSLDGVATKGPLAARAMGSMSRAVGGLTKSFTTFARGHFDLVLMAVAAFAFAAYQNNWLGFKSLVDAVTNSFRNLSAELDAAFEDVRDKSRIVGLMAEMGREGGVTFSSEFREALSNQDFAGRGLIEGMIGEMASGTGVIGRIAGPLFTTAMNAAINEVRSGFTDLWSSATYGATNAEEAVANVNKALQDAGLGVMEFWSAFEYGRTVMGLVEKDAGALGEAYAMAMRDGVAYASELEAALYALSVPADTMGPFLPSEALTQFKELDDAALTFLGVVTRAQEELQTLNATKVDDLIARLQTLPMTGLTEAQFIEKGTILDELNTLWRDLTPEYQKIVSDAQQAAFTGGVEDGLNAAMLQGGTIEQQVMQALVGMGATTIDPDAFAAIVESVNVAFNEAMAKGGELDDGTINWSEMVKTGLGSIDAKVVEDTILPEINKLGDGVASAIGSVFRPEKFKDLIKDVTSDKAGWKAFWTAVTDPILEAALEGSKGSEAQFLAEEYVAGLFSNFETAFPAAAGPARDKLVNQLKTFFNEETFPSLSPTMQRFGANMLTVMYESMNIPVPDWLQTFLREQGGHMKGDVQTGVDSGPPVTIGAPTVTPPPPASINDLAAAVNRDIGLMEFRLPAPTIPLPRFAGSGAPNMPSDRAPNESTGQAGGLMGGLAGFVNSMEQTVANANFTPPAIPVPDTTAATTAMQTATTAMQADIDGLDFTLPAVGIPDTSGAITAVRTMATTIQSILTGVSNNAYTWGQHLVDRYASGIRSNAARAGEAARRVAEKTARYLEFSEPPPGPLNKIREWGRHLVDTYARAMESNSPRVRRAAMKIADQIADALRALTDDQDKVARKVKDKNKDIVDDLNKTAKKIVDNVRGAETFSNYNDYLEYLEKVHNRVQRVRDRAKRDRDETRRDLVVDKERDARVTYETKKKQVIEIHLIAESPDGTVDRTELRALRRGIMDALALADLEHIVTVQ